MNQPTGRDARGYGKIKCSCGRPFADHDLGVPCPIVVEMLGGVDPIFVTASVKSIGTVGERQHSVAV